MSNPCTSSTSETSSSHSAFQDVLSSIDQVEHAEPIPASKSSTIARSEYFSVRTQAMMQSKSQFSLDDVEHGIEHSKVHWSEVIADVDSDDEEEVQRENWQLFQELTNDPQWTNPDYPESGHFFRDRRCKLGRKIAEGGQAEIFELLDADGNVDSFALVKVFKRGSRLSQLRQQWPLGILRREVNQCVLFGTMLSDGRFAFMMMKCWGDLRKLIDQAMREKNTQGPPFPYEWEGVTLHARDIMMGIALWMNELHKQGIIHRDLKASNILLNTEVLYPHVFVADFECSIGVQGTGFWRAPEILLALKNKVAIDFNEKVDVYSYGMTCYEIVTGCLPFEGELEPGRASNDLIIGGKRPKLPSDLDDGLNDLIQKCWDPIPIQRPTFIEISAWW